MSPLRCGGCGNGTRARRRSRRVRRLRQAPTGASSARAAPGPTPLEARALRLALEYVGPMIAADAHTPLSRVRKKLEETFGQFELARTPEPHVATEELDLVSRLARGMRERKLVEIEYQK